jgi:hypothetical protein
MLRRIPHLPLSLWPICGPELYYKNRLPRRVVIALVFLKRGRVLYLDRKPQG